jgi:hypothetical protein
MYIKDNKNRISFFYKDNKIGNDNAIPRKEKF